MDLNLSNVTDLAYKARGLASRVGLILSKNSPQILMWLGIAGGVGTTVLACIATTKATEIIDETKDEIDKLRDQRKSFDTEYYPNEDYNKDLATVYIRTAVDFVRLYGPSVILGIASTSAIISGHNILNKRNLGLMAAYKVVDESYKEYRKRVSKEFGDAKERELRYPGKSEEVVIGQDQEGKDIVDTRPVPWIDGQLREHETGRWFDDTNPRWLQDLANNHFFLSMQQNYWNNRLDAYGHVFLNDIYQSLGFEDTRDGQVIGWIKQPGKPCLIDFGLREFSYYIGATHLDSNNNENAEGFWLDFNVQGVILDMLDSK